MFTDDEIARLSKRLEPYVDGNGPITLTNIVRIHGGASRQTFKFDATRGKYTVGLILRRDPVASLIDTERALEFAAYQTFADSHVPAPRPLLLEETTETLGSPFFVMERIDGGMAGSPYMDGAFGPKAGPLTERFFSVLGKIASTKPAGTPLADVTDTPRPEECWKRELDTWATVIAEDALEPQPIALAAIRHLRANPPPPPQRLAIVHGDYRAGNFLHDGDGKLMAILDWEMAHIGDPLEDLAWALDPMWAGSDPERPMGGVSRARAMAIWEQSSGLTIDPRAWRWWSLFAHVKGLAIWISSGQTYASGANTDPINAWASLYCTQFHNRLISKKLLAEKFA
jgi:aminoglycoside phosphotransferase (APT) family kinase protein